MVVARQSDQWNHTCAIWFSNQQLVYMLGCMLTPKDGSPPTLPDALSIHPYEHTKVEAVDPEQRQRALEEVDRLKREMQTLRLIRDPIKVKAYMERIRREQH